jgi:uncharacterized lipoprotein YajG
MLYKKRIAALGLVLFLSSCATAESTVPNTSNFTTIQSSNYTDVNWVVVKDTRTGCEYLRSYGGDSSFIYIKGSCPTIRD